MLEKCSEENVRLSLVIVFGDLLFKFPNTVEPWTRLRDESWKVRRNTLLVLSHLVTNEMVKVKGQISEVALCIVDENEEIVDLAKRFFSELSLKGNTLYNVLPDIISHLSNPASDVTVEEKNFEIILKYIMDQIQKEKQLENLVEKLCKRMKESICERQWKDLAFCLSLLPWSDRSLRRLIDHAYCFCDRLLYQPVATLFLNIVATVTRSNKPGLKEIGAELNTIIDEVITKGSADHLQDPDDTVSELPSLPTKTPAKNPRKTPRKTPAKTPDDDLDERHIFSRSMKFSKTLRSISGVIPVITSTIASLRASKKLARATGGMSRGTILLKPKGFHVTFLTILFNSGEEMFSNSNGCTFRFKKVGANYAYGGHSTPHSHFW
ncbi:meiotic chromosome condensation [Homalodisca vitripennis]|nr:meiotic chromosome condensation [Homalodisca vitripennis]KAG8328831.1 meiotic chromosome condensation [Homalodisca vitripennis]